MKSTKISVEEVFGKMIMSDTINPEQIQKLNTYFSKDNVNISHKNIAS